MDALPRRLPPARRARAGGGEDGVAVRRLGGGGGGRGGNPGGGEGRTQEEEKGEEGLGQYSPVGEPDPAAAGAGTQDNFVGISADLRGPTTLTLTIAV